MELFIYGLFNFYLYKVIDYVELLEMLVVFNKLLFYGLVILLVLMVGMIFVYMCYYFIVRVCYVEDMEECLEVLVLVGVYC